MTRARRAAFATAALCLGLLAVVVVGEIALRLIGDTSAPRRHFWPGIYKADPDLGWVLEPNYEGVHVEYAFEAPTSTNSLGYRTPEWDATRAASAVRVLALGDSCTFGRGVDDAETWPARLEAHLRADGVDASVFDAGVPLRGRSEARSSPRASASALTTDVTERHLPELRGRMALILPILDFRRGARTECSPEPL